MSSMKRVRRVIPLTGGLGNQLFQLTFALMLKNSGYNIKIDTQLGRPRQNHFGQPEVASLLPPGFLQLTSKKTGSSFVSKCNGYLMRMTLAPRRYENSGIVRFLIKYVTRVANSIYLRGRFHTWSAPDLGYCQIPGSDSNLLINGYFQTYRWASDLRIFSALESLRPNESSLTREKFERIAKEERPLIIHIRLGDYTEEHKFGCLGIDYYATALHRIWDSEQYGKIWVFSDEINKASKFIPLEFHEKVRWIQDIDGSTAQTFQLMRFGHGYIIANSTFSWWSAFLSYNRSAKVVCPEPWFKLLQDPTDLIPPHWTRISANHAEGSNVV
jgi:hypothetical protein